MKPQGRPAPRARPAAPNDKKIQPRHAMPISGPSSYSDTVPLFQNHWRHADAALAPQALVLRLPGYDTAVTRAQFDTLAEALHHQAYYTVQSCLVTEQLARGGLALAKTALLRQLNLFTTFLDAYYRGTDLHAVRPHAPSIGDGQDKFTGPLLDAASLWEKINESPAPAGVTLPLVLRDAANAALTQAAFATALEALLAQYRAEKRAAQNTGLARARRNLLQDRAYATMKAYREAVPVMLAAFPPLLETLPRLTPLPGHTPAPVAATATFEPPAGAKVTYEPSADKTLHRYQLRGNAGPEYREEDAVVLGHHAPDDPREFTTTFGLAQPGAQIALKVFVILTTGNESGGATMVLEHPAHSPPVPGAPGIARQ